MFNFYYQVIDLMGRLRFESVYRIECEFFVTEYAKDSAILEVKRKGGKD